MNDGRFISDTIEAVLASMAESLREAQTELNSAPPLDDFGRPSPIYQIPYLDFEIGFRLQTQERTGGGIRLKFKPVKSGETEREVTSKISGRFVAVPPSDGLPIPILTVSTIRISDLKHTLSITASNSAGELLAGAPIEVNVDTDASIALSEAGGVSSPRITNAATLSTAIPVTNHDGIAEVDISLSATLQRNAIIVISVELGQQSVLVTLSKDEV